MLWWCCKIEEVLALRKKEWHNSRQEKQSPNDKKRQRKREPLTNGDKLRDFTSVANFFVIRSLCYFFSTVFFPSSIALAHPPQAFLRGEIFMCIFPFLFPSSPNFFCVRCYYSLLMSLLAFPRSLCVPCSSPCYAVFPSLFNFPLSPSPSSPASLRLLNPPNFFPFRFLCIVGHSPPRQEFPFLIPNAEWKETQEQSAGSLARAGQ